MSTLLPTRDDTLGPYYPPLFASEEALDLFRPMRGLDVGPIGEPVVLKVRLIDIDGRTADSTLLEVWQPNSKGCLRIPGSASALADDPFFEGYGRVYSPSGAFRIRTVMPGEMQVGSVIRAPWITLTIFSDGIGRIVTQVFFEGSSANDLDPVLRSVAPGLRERLIARRQPDESSASVFAIDIKMRGDGETPFFDDESA